MNARRSGKPVDPFYISKAWRRLRAIVLRDEPTCRDCKRARSTVAAHILSRRKRPDLELVRSNIKGACDTCHNSETVRRDGGFGFKPTDRRLGCAENGQPLDVGHHWNRGERFPTPGGVI